jgi:predicted phage tail protein
MLKKIKLYGELAEKYGKEWEFDIESPAEAIRALKANLEGFEQFLSTSQSRNIGYKIVAGRESLEAEELVLNTSADTIKIIPAILGAKSSWGKIIIGVVIIVVSCVYASCAGAGWGWGQLGLAIGMNLVMTGVAELLAPSPPALGDEEFAEKTENHGFGGPENTVNQGVAIPVCYGQLIVGGALISASITTEQIQG